MKPDFDVSLNKVRGCFNAAPNFIMLEYCPFFRHFFVLNDFFCQFPVIFSEIGVLLWEKNKKGVRSSDKCFQKIKKIKGVKPNVLYT